MNNMWEISHIFGIRGERITRAAQNLQDVGYLRYSRENIKITDKHQLQSRAYER
jgi:Mn-dependent DtxR family transcriptional regulator